MELPTTDDVVLPPRGLVCWVRPLRICRTPTSPDISSVLRASFGLTFFLLTLFDTEEAFCLGVSTSSSTSLKGSTEGARSGTGGGLCAEGFQRVMLLGVECMRDDRGPRILVGVEY